jgi:hypothetical protein
VARRSTAISCGAAPSIASGYGLPATHPLGARTVVRKGAMLKGTGPWLTDVFTVSEGGAMKIEAFGLGDGDKICIKRVLMQDSNRPTHENAGCAAVLCPVPPSIQSIASYTYCGKTVCLCKKQSIILLREPGYYALSFGTYLKRP